MNFQKAFTDHYGELIIISLIVSILIPVLSCIITIVLSWIKLRLPIPKSKLIGRNVLVIGAGQGLGKSLSKLLCEYPISKLTLVARDKDVDENGQTNLDKVIAECTEVCKTHVVIKKVSLDITDKIKVSKIIKTLVDEDGKIDWVVICAGSCFPGLVAFSEQDVENELEEKNLNINYLGTVNVIRAVLATKVYPERIVAVGSVASIINFAGMAAYSASKSALRGYMDALRNERFYYNDVNIHLMIPGTIDSPGLIRENETKPEVAKLIEGTADVFHPDQVAKALLQGVCSEKYLITNDDIGLLARILGNCVAPRYHIFDTLSTPISALVGEWFWRHADSICKTQAKKDIENIQ